MPPQAVRQAQELIHPFTLDWPVGTPIPEVPGLYKQTMDLPFWETLFVMCEFFQSPYGMVWMSLNREYGHRHVRFVGDPNNLKMMLSQKQDLLWSLEWSMYDQKIVYYKGPFVPEVFERALQQLINYSLLPPQAVPEVMNAFRQLCQ
jgi:hypothetical protein